MNFKFCTFNKLICINIKFTDFYFNRSICHCRYNNLFLFLCYIERNLICNGKSSRSLRLYQIIFSCRQTFKSYSHTISDQVHLVFGNLMSITSICTDNFKR